MTDQSATPAAPSRRPLWLALGGCVVLLLCALVVGTVGAGAWFLRQGSTPVVGEPAVEYVLDASPRMTAESDTGGTRLAVAQGVLAEVVRPADPSLTAGLRVFGSGAQTDSCKDTELVVPLAPSNQSEISSRALDVQAGAAADAAVGEAMLAAIGDLAATDGPHTLVVITGGADSCNAEAGQLIAQEAERAGIRLQTFVVGYQVSDEEAEAIRGMVDAAGDSTFLNALDRDALREILEAIQAYVDDPSTDFPTITLGTPAPVAVGPDATAAPNATSAPADPTDPSDPAATEVVEPGVTPEPSGYAAQSACDHPYYPLRLGATWTYAFEGGSYTWTVVEVSGDLESATAVMNFNLNDVVIDYHWNCTQAGVVSYDFGNIGLPTAGADIDFEVTSSSGAWLLPPEQMVPGATWENAYSMNSSYSMGGVSVSMTTDVAESFTAGGIESVTTAAGSFDALRVNGNSTYNMTNSLVPASSAASANTVWFAYGVGMVRNESSSEGTNTTIDLVSYSIP